MLRIFCLLFVLASTPSIAASPLSIVILGDSLSAAYGIPEELGWVQKLRERLATHQHDASVINASVSGDTSDGGAARLPDLLQRHQPQLVIIALGGNDGLRGQSIKQLRTNLGAMASAAQDQDAQVIIVGVDLPPNYGAAYLKRFKNAFVRVAEEHQTLFVPSLVAGLENHLEWLQSDGIHPDTRAQTLLLDNVWPSIAKALDIQG